MTIEITYSDYFYTEGERYEVSENTRWGCYMVESDKSLIRIPHATKKIYCNCEDPDYRPFNNAPGEYCRRCRFEKKPFDMTALKKLGRMEIKEYNPGQRY